MLRVANCSGFYGDRLSAAREQVEGGHIDVLTGDWLAELTMLILAGNRLKGRPGYATTFVKQLADVLGTCLDRGIKVVSNAGGLDPAACAQAVRDLGLPAKVATVTGDDLMPRLPELGPLVNLDTGETLTAGPITANAYLGGFPIAAALSAGADVVVTGRVTDAALVTGPGIWRYGWRPTDLDALAGSVVAGHIIECGCQATGGNYSFFEEIPDLAHCGFPIAELHDDGSCVITKHPGTGGTVTVGTVTAQLLYEISGPSYPGPDVTARFDTIRLMQDGPDRVSVSGVRGDSPPPTLKAAVNVLGGYRNTMTLVVTGLDVAGKARVAEEAIWARVPRESFEQTYTELTGDLLRITVMDSDRRKAGRLFSSAVVETGLASYPGFHGLTPPGDASPYGVYWPVAVPRESVHVEVALDGSAIPFGDDAPENAPRVPRAPLPDAPAEAGPWFSPPMPIPLSVEEELRPLGLIAGARSGDKGGNANLGVWVRNPDHYAWLASYLTADRLPELLPEVAGLRVDRFVFPNLLAVNFVVHGLLGRGVAASPLMDAQAKALGERLRAIPVPLP
ncbi:acyclic terpene utilization AtuA family protein [Herbidospora mongoliensis]|uniref:acyclic terpene utilization AtuA family protein n=1 Tax=Herbidospora mongoliensis TaxID=688067 RepID=UPI00082D2E41|nr:acyclic terpene utilization AtuA family protein [Herbidospora mongoliensis]